jgi:hypothetical protein
MTTAPPWEVVVIMPGGTSDLVYDRVVSVHRARTEAVVSGVDTVGLGTYSGLQQSTDPANPAGEAVLYTGLPASIQPKTPGRTKGTLLPGDIIYKPEWSIYIPASAISQFDIRDRDFVYDDEGYRYAVAQNFWTVFGYQLVAIRLET